MYIFILLLALYGAKFNFHGYTDDCVSRNQCNAVKGFWIMLIFMRHAMQYIKHGGYKFDFFGDGTAKYFDNHIYQLVVACFLFYSGYGVMTSLMTKGKAYADSIPRRRILNTLLNFDVAVLIFIVSDFIVGVNLDAYKVVASLLAWESVGNSNWYIFVILVCYFAAYAGYKSCGLFFRETSDGSCGPIGKCAMTTSVFVLAFMLVMMNIREKWWSDTVLCFPAGMAFCEYREKIEDWFRKYYPIFLLLFVGVLSVLICLISEHICVSLYPLMHNIAAIDLCALTVLLSMKVSLGNKALCWFGANLFPIYIYQRVPMNILSHCCGNSFVCNYPHLFIIISLLISLVIAYLYRFWQVKL